MAKKSLIEMNAEELAEATAEFEREFIFDTFETPDAEAPKKHDRARRKRGRPVRGQGAQAISVTIEKTILKMTDKLAKQQGVTRAQFIERALLSTIVRERTSG